jgi:L-alanine-DL-glutamate epimerase-like enolase superfamily enzyme
MSASEITRIRGYVVQPVDSPAVRFTGQDELETWSLELVRLTLRDGNEGVAGSATGWMGAEQGTLCREMEVLGKKVMGEDVRARSAITAKLLKEPREELPQAESLFDVAMWDAYGHQVNAPLWQLLGGFRETIPAYASTPAYLNVDEYLEITQQCIDAGYRAIKFHMNCDSDFDLEMVQAVQKTFPDSGLRFMVDLEQRYHFDAAVHLGRALSKLPYDWMEAPFEDTDFDTYIELNRIVGVDVLPAGNSLIGLKKWEEALGRCAWSRLRCDANNAGGITTLCQAMALAEAHGVKNEIQSWGFPISQFSNLHVMLGLPGCSWFEYPFPAHYFGYGAKNPLRLDAQGCVRAHVGAGLGIEMDWERIEADACVTFDLR